MGTWEEIAYKAKDLTDAAGRKAADLAQSAKLQFRYTENEKIIDEALRAIGQLVYDSWSDADEPDEKTVAELVARVDELTRANADIASEIEHLRGCRLCRSCNAKNPVNARFCLRCGKPL